jgi:hypothetical protein
VTEYDAVKRESEGGLGAADVGADSVLGWMLTPVTSVSAASVALAG